MNKCCDHSCRESDDCPRRQDGYDVGCWWIAFCAGVAIAVLAVAFIDLQRPCPLFLPIACH